MGLFILVLLGGMLFFLWEYATKADEWVAFPGSPHVYNNSNIGTGTIVDRFGTVLLRHHWNGRYRFAAHPR